MGGQKAERIERGVDAGAAVLFAAAVAFAALKIASWPWASVAALLGFAAGLRGLRAVRVEEEGFPLGTFAAIPLEFEEPPELLLTDADRVRAPSADEQELILDDILARLDPDSRVVRLFDPAAMPSPGELGSQIDRHLGRAGTSGDASRDLYAALDQLRRSLR